MLQFIILFAFAVHGFCSPVPDSSRIVNGVDAKPGEFPYIVSLRLYDKHMCGASILDETHVLTAAHCPDGEPLEGLSIQYGVVKVSSDDHQVIPVEKVFMHERFGSWGTGNDVAVLKLSKPIPLGEDVQPVVLPEQDEDIPAGKPSILAGWGRNTTEGSSLENLQRVDLLVYSDAECRQAHGWKVSKKYHLCSGVLEGGKGQCNGDSGGPLYSEGKQIGAVSWSVKPCAIKGYPGVFARIARYINWINEKRAL